MFWIEMHGSDGRVGVDAIGFPFLTIDEAAAKAKELGKMNTFHWGRATGYRIRDERKTIVHEGNIPHAQHT